MAKHNKIPDPDPADTGWGITIIILIVMGFLVLGKVASYN